MNNKNTIPGSWAEINKDESSAAITASEIADAAEDLRETLRWIEDFTSEAQLQDNSEFCKSALQSVCHRASTGLRKFEGAVSAAFVGFQGRAMDHARKEVSK